MGGKINIVSEEKVGTEACINLDLPYIKNSAKKMFSTSEPIVKKHKEAINQHKNYTILLAEDNIINQKMVKRFLRAL